MKKKRISNALWRNNNPEKVKEQKKRYYEKNKIKISSSQKKYYEINKDVILERNKKWRYENKNICSMISKKWRNKNKYYSKEVDINRRAKHLNPIIPGTIQLVYEKNIKENGYLKCCLCDKHIKFGEDSIEHLIPISRGGTHDIENLGISHGLCNSKKRKKTFKEYKKGVPK